MANPFQEIKAEESQFETSEFKKLGYYCFWHSAKKKGSMDENVKTPCIVRISAMQIQKIILFEDFSWWEISVVIFLTTYL